MAFPFSFSSELSIPSRSPAATAPGVVGWFRTKLRLAGADVTEPTPNELAFSGYVVSLSGGAGLYTLLRGGTVVVSVGNDAILVEVDARISHWWGLLFVAYLIGGSFLLGEPGLRHALLALGGLPVPTAGYVLGRLFVLKLLRDASREFREADTGAPQPQGARTV